MLKAMLKAFANNTMAEWFKKNAEFRKQKVGEEIANAVIHGVGVLLSIAALVLLVVVAAGRGDAWRVVSLSIYGATLVFLYLSSTLYHSLAHPGAKRLFKWPRFFLSANTKQFPLCCMWPWGG